jgi:spore maturation protein CgeB
MKYSFGMIHYYKTVLIHTLEALKYKFDKINYVVKYNSIEDGSFKGSYVFKITGSTNVCNNTAYTTTVGLFLSPVSIKNASIGFE